MGSRAETVQKDQRVVADSAQNITSPESVMTQPYSVALTSQKSLTGRTAVAFPNSVAVSGARDMTIGSVTFSQFTPEVQETLFKLSDNMASSTNSAIQQSSAQSASVLSALSEQLEQAKYGITENIMEFAKLIGIAIAIYFAIKVLR